MTAPLGGLERTSRRALVLMSIALAVIGGTLGAALEQAFAKEINCSHEWAQCVGTWSGDIIWGWENTNEIHGEPGLDNAWGWGAQDWLYGHSEADALFGGVGPDLVHGDSGNDSYYVVAGGAGYGVYGNSEADGIEGNTGHDLVQGDYGQDDMRGGDNEDYLFAEDDQPDSVQGGGQWDGCWVDGKDSYAGCENVV